MDRWIPNRKRGPLISPQLLRQIPYFAPLEPDSEALLELARATRVEEYEKGEILFLEGDPCEGVYYTVAGQIRIFKSSPDGREQTLRLMGPGSTFNEVAVLDGGPSPASAEAMEDSLIWIVPTEAVVHLFDTEPRVARYVIRNLAGKLRHMTMLVGEISLKQVTARVAKVLLSQDSVEPVLGVGVSNQVTTQLTQQQMAAMVGTVREMVGRALKTLEKSGAIQARRGHIEIKDSSKLEEFL